ncbi:hypothetical protein LCGC14_0475770 [marine sediment metagenome]|uniref:Uncharacterized protein n=1 Tax=marine sediment metagenome TaxID=412755 RepID=A0A0F9SAR1_9ZZZZ
MDDSGQESSSEPKAKICSGACKAEKPATRKYFSPAPHNKDRLASWCKICAASYARAVRSGKSPAKHKPGPKNNSSDGEPIYGVSKVYWDMASDDQREEWKQKWFGLHPEGEQNE